jgi:hypothetical protein
MANHVESEKTQQFWKAVCGAVAAGMDPNDAAGFVVEAIQNDQFWIFSHPHVPATALKQAKAMAESQELIDL